jgi:hypothetical protein
MRPPSCSPQQGPYGERCSVSRALDLFLQSFIHIFHSPHLRSSPTKMGESTVTIHKTPHGRRPLYNGVGPGSTWGSFTSLPSLPQCHAAFSTIPSTFAWVHQSFVSQRVVVTLYRCPLHTCYRLPRDPSYGCMRPYGTEERLDLWEAHQHNYHFQFHSYSRSICRFQNVAVPNFALIHHNKI